MANTNMFETYNKSKCKGRDQGKNYESLLCTVYALKLSYDEKVKNFKISANNKKYDDFDDVVLEVEFSNGIRSVFLFQLKYKEERVFVTDQKLNANGEFSVKKCFKSFLSLKEIENPVCILATNAKCRDSSHHGLDSNMMVKCQEQFWMSIVNTNEDNTFFKITNKENHFFSEEFCDHFYLLTNQADINTIKSLIEKFVRKTLQCDIQNRFISFMQDWFLKTFKLTKDDIVAKLVELAFSPWIQTLSSEKANEKSELISRIIMNFDVSITNSDEDTVDKIWNISQECDEILEKFGIRAETFDKERSIALWYLNKVPLVVKVNDSNKLLCRIVNDLFDNCQGKKRIVFIGDVDRGSFKGSILENLENLSHLEERDLYKAVIKHFTVSLQGRQNIPLNSFLQQGSTIEKYITTSDLLKMSQETFSITDDKKQEKLPKDYISRSVSAIFLNTFKTIEASAHDVNSLLIFNCEENFKQRLQEQYRNIHFVEVDDFLSKNEEIRKMKEDRQKNHFVLLSTKSKCTNLQFSEVCGKVFQKSSHVYLLQVVNEDDSILLLRTNNKLLAKQTMKIVNCRSEMVKEEEIFTYFSNPLNIFVAPPGIGKSTLFTYLSQNCPPEFWCLRVNLINHIGYLRSGPKKEEVLLHFLELSEKAHSLVINAKKLFLENKKLHIFLDGLDEIDSTCVNFFLDFIRFISSQGFRVWVSSRENLRELILYKLNVMPISIQELTKNQQIKYIEDRLKSSYSSDEIDKVIAAVFRSKDIPSVEQLLGIPLQLFIITENFLEGREMFENLERENIFVLTNIYKKFFAGKRQFQHKKTKTRGKEKQLGFSNFENHLRHYEIPAVKAVLNKADFKKLDVKVRNDTFLNRVALEGDKFGIIKEVNKYKQAIYVHQTFAEYFACVWFCKPENLKKVAVLRNELFSEKYENLKYIFDIMLAEDNPLHLAVIYKSVELFNQFAEEHGEKKDKGGRSPLHLACCYGNKYPVIDLRQYKSVNRESQDYVVMVGKLMKCCKFSESDKLFGLDCIGYAARSHCLYVIEKFLEVEKTDLSQLYDVYQSKVLLTYYCSELGYSNLLSALVTEDSKIFRFEKYYIPSMLKIAVMGSRDHENSEKNSPKVENVSTVRTFLEKRGEINGEDQWDNDVLDLACQNGWYDMMEVLLDFGAKCSRKNTVLHITAEYGKLNERMMELMKTNKTDINARNEKGETALHLTCQGPVDDDTKLETLKFLLGRGADIHAVTNNNSNMLHYAAKDWNPCGKVMELLICNGIDINVQNDNGESPLYLSCFKENISNTKFLLDNGANPNAVAKLKTETSPLSELLPKLKLKGLKLPSVDINAQGINGHTPLHIICEFGNFEIAKLLLERGADLSILTKDGDNFLHHTLRGKEVNDNIVKLLLVNGISVNSQNGEGETALHIACENGHLDIVKILLDKGGDLNVLSKENNSVLHCAARNWVLNREVINLLADRGVDVNFQNEDGDSALCLVWKAKSFGNVKTLLANGADVNHIVNEENPLHFAVKTTDDNSEIINILIDHGVDVDCRDRKGATPLHIACKHGSVVNVEALLKRGADVNSVTNDGMYVLHYAVKTKHPNKDVVTFLKNSIDVDVSNNRGETPLHISCQIKCLENVEALLTSGSAINSVTVEKKNALHYAVKAVASVDLVQCLVNRGIKINAQDCEGKAPLHIACEENLYNLAKLLLGRNADVNLLTSEGKNILHFAAESRNYKLMNKILAMKFDRDLFIGTRYQNNRTILHCAVLTNETDEELLKTLIAGVDVLLEDTDGKNALDFAFENGCYKAVDTLLKTGLFVYSVTSGGVTSLHYSVYSGSCSGVKMFLKKRGIDDVHVDHEELPLYFVSRNGRLDKDSILTLTQKIGGYISSRNSNIPVPVHHGVVEYLKKCFCDRSQTNFILDGVNLNRDISRHSDS